jgi:hypothetical protein
VPITLVSWTTRLTLSLARAWAGYRLRQYPSITADHLRLIDASLGSDEALLPRLAAAVTLVGRADPRRCRRMQLDVRRIVVLGVATPNAGFDPYTSAIYVRCGVVAECTAQVTAALLVHEATHARIWRAGVHEVEPIHARLERRCWLETLAFVLRVPDNAVVRDWVVSILDEEAWGTYAKHGSDQETAQQFRQLFSLAAIREWISDRLPWRASR